MNESVKAALAAREKRKNTATSNKVSAALEARKTRIENEARQRNLYGILYNNSLAKDQAAGKLSPETHSLAKKVFEPENNPFHIDYKQEMARQDIADKTAKHVSDVLSKEAAEKERLMSYDLEAGVKRIDDANKAIYNFDNNTSEKATELDERIAASAFGFSNDSRARQEAAAEKARMKQVERGEALLDEWRDAHADQQKAAELQTEALVTYNKEPDNTGINKKQPPFNTTSVSQDIEDAREKAEMQELLFRYGFTNPKADTVTMKAEEMILDEAVLTSINAYDRLKKIEDAERSFSVTGYYSTYHNTDIIKANIEAGRYSIISDYYEALAQNDPDRDAYIALGKERMGDFYTTTAATAEYTGIDYGIFNFAKKQYAEMTDKQLETYYYLAGKHLGYQYAYKNAIEKGLNEAVAKKDREQLEALVKEHPVMYGVSGYVANTMQSPAVALDMLVSKGTGKSYDPNSYLSSGARNASVISEEIINGIDSPTGQWWAQLGLSTAQFAAHLPFGPAGVYLMGAEAMGTTAYEAYKNGATVDEALILGAVAGVAETALEEMPFDNVLTAFKGGSKEAMEQIAKQLSEGMYKEARRALAKELSGAVVKTGIEEGMEELLTEYINNISNQLVLGERSDFNKYVNALMTEEHLTEEEAYKKAILQYYVTNPALAFAGGFVSGSAMTAGGNLINAPRYAVDVHNSKAVARNAAKSQTVPATTPTPAANGSNMPRVPTSSVDSAEAAKAFSQYAQGVFESVDNDTYETELMSDPEIADAVSDMDAGEGNTFTPSDGVIKARDVHEDFRNTGKFIPDTPTQEFRKAEAAKAKNDIQRSGILAGASKADIRLAEIMSALTGRNVIFESDDYRINGHFDGDNTIFVNVDRADGIFAQVLAHELTHSVEGTKAYAGIVKAVRSFVEANTFTDDNGVTHDWNYYFTEAHAEQDKIYPKLTGKPFTDAKADAEVVAKVLQGFFADNAADAARTQVALDTWLAETVKTNKTGVTYMWHKLSQIAKRIRSDIKDIRARKAEGYDAAARERELMLRRIEDIRDRFGRALIEAKKAAAKKGDAALSANKSEKHFTADKYFKSIMDRWQDLKHGSYVKVGTIDSKHPLALIGMPDGIIRYDVDKLKKNMDDHADYLTITLLKSIPDILSNPVAISEYSKDGTVSVFGDVFIDRSPMMVGVTISKDRAGNDINKVRTFNTRRDVGKLITDDTVLYLDNNKKRTLKWFQACGIQVPLGGTKFGFIRSISQKNGFVNTSGESYSIGAGNVQANKQNVEPISEDMYRQMEEHFGTTRNYDVAGYILPDGKMLDFSGKHWGDTSSDMRQVDHRDISEVTDGDGKEDMIRLIGSGGIRLSPESGGINLAVMPNSSQMYALRGYINHFGGEVIIDVDAIGGDTVHSFEYNRGTSSSKILADIKAYFENGTIPETQSDLGKFRYSYTPDGDYIGTKPINDAESANRKRALEMYRQLDAGKDIGNGNMDPAEYIYMQTGWAYDGLGNFIVDHEAPIYIDSSEQHRMTMRRADHTEGVNNALRSENAGLRDDVQKWKRRTAAAEDAAKRLARDWRLSKERKLSADYVPSRDQVRGIVSDLGDMLGGGFSDVQIREYTNRLLDIYDRMGHDGKLDLTNYTSEIVALIDDMQSVEFVNEDNKALADSVRPELQVPVFLSEKARGDFAEGYGKTAKAYRGKVNFVSKANGTPVDVRYMELSERFPNLFPADITNEADQAKKMLEVADKMREDGFTTRDRYSDVGAEPDVVRADDLSKAIARIVEGYEKLETKPRTFADGLLRTLEYERREHKRELARMTEEERAKAEAKHNKEVERLLGEAEAAMEWETEYLKRHLSEAEGELKAIDDKAKADAEAKVRRAHLRGKDIKDAAIKAAKADGSFTSIMTKLHERHTQLENELAKVQAQCDKYAKVKASQMSSDGGAYVKQLREHRDQLAEDLSNLTAYINKVYQRVKSIRTDEYVDMIVSDGNLADWKDKKIPLSYQIETMRRNILGSKPKNRESKLADHIINDILDPIVDATAQAISVKNEIRDRVKKLDLSTKVRKGDTLSESQFVQALGEAQSNIEALDSGEGAFIYNKYGIPMREGMTADEWRGYLNRIIEENPSITKDESNMKRMRDAVKEFKDIYDQLFTIVNAARVRNGYAPVPYHRGYFPHYNNDTKQDGILSSLFEGLGFRQSEISEKLPTSINGLTATFRPGIRYMSNAKQRSLAGFAGEYQVTGAVEGIDRYLETAADVAFMTDHIQNLRSLSDAIRYATTTDATKKRIEEINADDTLSRDEKRVRKDEIFANRTDATKYALNHLVPDIEEYANILSGKKSRYDRTPENLVGRSLYTTGRKFMSRVASNQIVLNVGSWITNTVPLTTGTAVMHYNMLTGLADTIKGMIADDGFAARSTFLTSRRGSDRLVKSGIDMASEIGGYGMTWVDQIVSEWLMRARVRQNMSKLGKGMSEAAAIAEADKFISGMMAQRTKAEMPTIFASQNPLAKMFTMYQLEVKNNLSFLFKDMPREYKDETVKLIVKMFAIFLLSRIYNDYFEELTGRRPSFDPLEMLNDLSGDLSGYKIASADDFFRGKFVEKSEKKNAIDAFTNLGKSAAEEIPFVGGLLGGGRVPISSAMPDWDALGRALKGTAGHFYGEDDPRSENAMGINNIIEELYNGLKPLLYYGATPLGGGQLKKVVEGGVSLAQGGSYNYSTSGAPQLQYPMYTDEKDGIWNAAKAIVFGKTATSGGREWVEGGFGQLSAKRTAVYEELVSSGASQRESFEAVKAVGGAGSKQIDKARALLELELDDDAKLILFSNMVTESAKKIESAKDSIQSGVGIDTYLEGLIKELEEDNADSDTIEESSKSQTKSNGSQYKFNIPEVKVPEVKVPKVEVPKFNFNFK